MKKGSQFFRFFPQYLRTQPLQMFGFCYGIIAIIIAIIGPFIVPYNPTEIFPDARLLPPSMKFWFGTDINQMDVFSRTICSYRTDLLIALLGALIAFGIGTSIGIFVGSFDVKKGFFGLVSMLIMRVMDVIQAFPIFVLALVLVAALGPSARNIILCIFITNLPLFLRLARSEALSIKGKTYIEAAKASGNSDLRIAFSHILPNALTQCVAMISAIMGFGILLTAGISFVGAGIRAPTPEWGLMISVGASSVITGQWWPSFFPGLFMAITIFAFSMMGEAITAIFDPLERRKLGLKGE